MPHSFEENLIKYVDTPIPDGMYNCSDRKVWILFWLSLVKNGNKLVETELNNSVFLILS